MRWYYKWRSRLGNLLRPSRKNDELNLELEQHLDASVAYNIEQGMPPEEARKAALREFGNAEALKEDCRDSWGVRFIHDIQSDARLACRQIGKNRGYSIVVIAILALCIGANSSIFSMLNNVVLKAYPYPDSNRLAQLGDVHVKTGSTNDLRPISVLKYLEYKELNIFESIGLYRTGGDNLHFDDQAFRVITGRVLPSFFEALQVQPLLGRVFEEGEQEPGKSDVLILSYDLWQTAFHGDVGVVGRRVDIEGMSFEVIGVMPDEFGFMQYDIALWRPHIVTPRDKSPRAWNRNRLAAIARLKPGVSVLQAQAALDVLDSQIYEAHPERRAFIDRVGRRSQIADYRSYVARNSKDILYLLQASVIIVFIIGCANIANLVFSKTTVRLKEIAMRVSLGARRGRIARMLLVEGAIYGALAGFVGLALGVAGLELIRAYELYSFPRSDSLSFDWPSVAFNFALAIASGLVIGAIPLLLIRERSCARLMHGSGRASTSSKSAVRFRQVLTIGQVALTCVLLIAAGLMLLSLKKLLSNETGFEPESLMSASFELPNSSKPRGQLEYCNKLLERLSEIPEVRSVALNSFVPFFGFWGGNMQVHIEGHGYSSDNQHPTISASFTQGPFFETVGIPLLRGRVFAEEDMLLNASKVAVIDERFAREHFPEDDPIGKRFTWELNGPYSARSDAEWITIVGVVGRVKAFGLEETSEQMNPFVYLNFGAFPRQYQRFVIRVAEGEGFNLDAFKADVRLAMADVSSTVPSTDLQWMSRRIDQTLLERKAVLRFLAAFGGLALLLSVIGLYGILSYAVTLRRKEFGVRRALGASRRKIIQSVLVQGLLVSSVGLLLGLIVAYTTMPLIENRLYQTNPYEFTIYFAIMAILIAVAYCSSFFPALRAAKLSPATALRID